MADKDNPFEDSEEYQFEKDDIFQLNENDDNDDTGDVFQLPDDDDELDDDDDLTLHSSSPSNYLQDALEKIKQEGAGENLIPLLVGGAVVLVLFFSIYMLISSLFSSPESSDNLKEVTPVVEQTAPQKEDEIEVASPAASPEPQPELVNEQQQQLADMQQKIIDFNQRISQLEKNDAAMMKLLDDLQTQQDNTVAKMDSMGKGITNIQSQVVKLNNALTKILAAVKQNPAAVPASQSQKPDGYPAAVSASQYPPAQGMRQPAPWSQQGAPQKGPSIMPQPSAVSYHVQALIPGRAWLKSSEGKIFTVTVGDVIGNYGRILEINPEKGYVTTDRGTKIEYGIDQF